MKTARPFFIRWIIGGAIIFACGAWGAALWVESPSGARFLSRCVTVQVQRQVPGTVVTLEQVRLRWPLTARLQLVRWGKPGQTPILRLDWVVLSARPPRWLRGDWVWIEEAEISRLDLAALDQVLTKGKWKADGYLAGRSRFRGTGSVVQEADLHLRTLSSGGRLSGDLLQRLFSLMPQGDTRGKLLGAIQAKSIFHFDMGRVEVVTEGAVYRFSFLLDGDHLLDVTILVPKEGLGILNQLLNLQ